jgi:hypothetical protein
LEIVLTQTLQRLVNCDCLSWVYIAR